MMPMTASTPTPAGTLTFGQWFRTTKSVPRLLAGAVGGFVFMYGFFGISSVIPWVWIHTPLHEVAIFTTIFTVLNVCNDFRLYRRSTRAKSVKTSRKRLP